MKNKNVLIVGYGIVGKLEYKNMKALNPDIYDIEFEQQYYKDCVDNYANTKRDIQYDIAFICVPTPYVSKENPCNVSAVWDAVRDNDAKIYVIKSTVLPGTCDEIAAKTGKHIVFSPEHAGATQHCNNFTYDFTILGGDKNDCCEVIQALQLCYDARHQFKITDRKTAETSKYMLNAFLATKVSFCVQFYELCQGLGISYEELRELFLLDTRINPAHTFVYKDAPYWDSHCFNKDVPAIAETFDMTLLKSVVDFNNNCKENYSKHRQ